ncbi:hypothetical protein GCM10025877_10490 [Agromyces mangrovi Wang et al. 2018]|nr:hypothetical protein GCM10025877_10490 [Agromyces mangrovi]
MLWRRTAPIDLPATDAAGRFFPWGTPLDGRRVAGQPARYRQLPLERITWFLDRNYPCRCTDPECPGNEYEAITLLEMIRDDIAPDAAREIFRLRVRLGEIVVVDRPGDGLDEN